ncbi:MAG: ketoacyl-ACP synthase III [Clostridiales bacterium]|nr:ketoacyl-ACP synthase III [Clostridiales bacterium]
MNSIKIIANGVYLPDNEISNEALNEIYNLENNWIYKRTGIKKRWYETGNTIEKMAINAVENLINNNNLKIEELREKVGVIVVATTSSTKIMPGISNEVQKYLGIKECICLDISAGCSGYINALDIVRKYICLDNIDYGLVIGVEKLSEYVDKEDINTRIILGDGAGVTLVGKSTRKSKKYYQKITSTYENNEILVCDNQNKCINMNGKSIYKYATTYTVNNIKEILEQSKICIDDIKYIVPHQSNKRILDAITQKLELSKEKVFSNIENIGNTFCASIPIALNEMIKNNLIKDGDLIILLGYGGGLNLGSILLEF